MKRFSNIVDKSKKKNMVGISCVVASIIIISSAIVVSLPSINFASIQESAFGNEVDDNFVLQENIVEEENAISENTVAENVVNNIVLVEDKSETENEVKSSENIKDIKTKETKVIEGDDTSSEENDNVKVVKAKVTDFSKNEVIYGYSSDEEGSTTKKVAVAVIPELICPLENYTITSRFGKRSNGIHTGLDLQADQGTPIRASASGIVVYSGYKGSYGNLVIIDHGNEFQTYYAQCKDLNVEVNESVEKGDIIATVGSTGNSTGPHLHFETRNRNNPVDPENILNNFNSFNP